MLTSTMADLRQRRLRLEADMRLLMAYGRCSVMSRLILSFAVQSLYREPVSRNSV